QKLSRNINQKTVKVFERGGGKTFYKKFSPRDPLFKNFRLFNLQRRFVFGRDCRVARSVPRSSQ
ncbi:MAG: hypothetical protein LBL66_02235, partial [Clostridiales bacterium]|nr:hypothetical protein [Clostridiales bacterium]